MGGARMVVHLLLLKFSMLWYKNYCPRQTAKLYVNSMSWYFKMFTRRLWFRDGCLWVELLFDPRRRRRVWRLGFDGKLLHRVLQGRLVAGKVCRYRVVEQQKLLVHYFNLKFNQSTLGSKIEKKLVVVAFTCWQKSADSSRCPVWANCLHFA